MQHLRRLVWKPIDWYPESPDRYEGGVPVPKPQGYFVILAGDVRSAFTALCVQGLLFGKDISVSIADESGISESCLTIPADKVLDVVDALLYVHRRTHEHEYDDVDWSEDEEMEP